MMDQGRPIADPEPRGLVSAAELARRALSEGDWRVPVEMVLACTSSLFKPVVEARHARGAFPKSTAKVFLRGDRFFGIVEFQPSNGKTYPDILMPLDLWTLEAGGR